MDFYYQLAWLVRIFYIPVSNVSQLVRYCGSNRILLASNLVVAWSVRNFWPKEKLFFLGMLINLEMRKMQLKIQRRHEKNTIFFHPQSQNKHLYVQSND